MRTEGYQMRKVFGKDFVHSTEPRGYKNETPSQSGGLQARRFLFEGIRLGTCRLVAYHRRETFDKEMLCTNTYSWLIRRWFRFLLKDSAALIGVNSMKSRH